MTDALPSNADIERIVKQHPLEILSRLPDSIERREAERLVRDAETLAHQARERRPGSADA